MITQWVPRILFFISKANVDYMFKQVDDYMKEGEVSFRVGTNLFVFPYL